MLAVLVRQVLALACSSVCAVVFFWHLCKGQGSDALFAAFVGSFLHGLIAPTDTDSDTLQAFLDR